MIKRIILIVLALLLASAPALGAGKLTVNQERMSISDAYGTVIVDIYAEVENTGDQTAAFSAGLVELFGADGSFIDSTDYVYSYPSILAPGERGYLYVSIYPENVESVSDIADYALTVTGKGSNAASGLLKAAGRYEPNVQEAYWTTNYMVAEVTNDTADTAYDIYCVFALKDADGKLLYCYYTTAYSIGIPAGSTIIMRTSVPDSTLEALAADGLVPAAVEAVAYLDPY